SDASLVAKSPCPAAATSTATPGPIVESQGRASCWSNRTRYGSNRPNALPAHAVNHALRRGLDSAELARQCVGIRGELHRRIAEDQLFVDQSRQRVGERVHALA